VLDYLHTREPSIIFRDLKPANVMRTSAGHLYLIDFGIARHFKPGQPRDTVPLGSPGYAAPEQYGRAQTTPRADIYSLGALLHQLLTGNNPAQNPFRFELSPLQGQSIPHRLQSLVMQMVEMDVNNRPSSMVIAKTVAWSPDGTRIASGGRDKTVQVWDAVTGHAMFTYHDHSSWVYTVAWSPDGTRIASAGNDGTVQVWQAV
jgi:serine/threonine protein kinase